MKANIALFMLLLCSFASKANDVEDCPPCEVVKKVKVCFVDPTEDDGLKGSLTARKACGAGVERILVHTQVELKNKLKAMADSCMAATETTFFGHSDGFHLTAGHIEVRDFPFIFQDAQCLFSRAQKPAIKLIACDAGKGCLGRLMMFQLARAAFPVNGTVYAPMAGCLASPIDISSKNGKWAHMDYLANSPNKEITFQDTFWLFGNDKELPGMKEVCSEDIDRVFAEVNDRGGAGRIVGWKASHDQDMARLHQLYQKLKDPKVKDYEIFPSGHGLGELLRIQLLLDSYASKSDKTGSRVKEK